GLANVLEQHLRAAKLRSPEVVRGQNGTVDVSLGGEVDDRLATACGPRDVTRNRDVAVMELDVVGQVRTVARVGELVEDDDRVAATQQPLDERRADESRATGD